MSGYFIYFLRPVGQVGPIKIGCSSHPQARLDALMTWAPIPLEIIATVPGDFNLEKNIHECFAADFSHHEWFHASDRVVEFVGKVAAGVPVHEAVDLTKRTKILNGKHDPKVKLRTSYSQKFSWAGRKVNKAKRDAYYVAPADVQRILERWAGWNPSVDYVEQRDPSPAEFVRLDEVLADPFAHFVSHGQEVAA